MEWDPKVNYVPYRNTVQVLFTRTQCIHPDLDMPARQGHSRFKPMDRDHGGQPLRSASLSPETFAARDAGQSNLPLLDWYDTAALTSNLSLPRGT
jgi:hypothetical protein